MNDQTITRRELLRLMGLTGASVVLGACGQQAASPAVPTTAPPATGVPTSAPPSAKVIELRYTQHWHTKGIDAHYDVLEWAKQTFEEKNPNIKIVYQDLSPDDSIPKIRADCAAGDCPEIVHQTEVSWWQSGWLLDLTSYVTGAWKDRFIPGSLDPLSADGHLFALPLEYSPLVAVWNTELIDGLGKKVPTTWDEFVDLGEAAKSKGFYLASFPSWQDGTHFGNGFIFSRPGGAEAVAKGQWDNEAVRYALTKMKDLVDKKLNPPNDAELNYAQGMNLFQQRKLLSFMDGAWTINNNLTPKKEDKFGLAKSVAFTPFMKTEGGLGASVRVFSNGVGLSAKLKDDPDKRDAALKFMDFMTSEEAAMKFIVLGQSPEAVKVKEMPKDQVPLLAALLDVTNKAEILYTGAVNKVLLAHMWDHFNVPSQAILVGKSVDEAVKAYVEQMKKYESGS